MTKVVLASDHEATIERITQVLAEAEGVTLVQVAGDGAAAREALARFPDLDILLVDVALDGGQGFAVARAVASTHPLHGLAILVDQADPERMAEAMDSGVRSVIPRSATLAEVVARLDGVAQWVSAARAAVSSEAGGRAGTVIAVAGAKGGVGTSVVSVLLARQLLGTRSVGLVDFDLQSGDLAAYLGVYARRSVVDLVDIAGEMGGRILREVSYDVPGGIRLLAAPNDGEREEEMTASAARALVGALRYQFDASVIDLGSHLTESTASILEEVDVVVLLTAPDLPALRAARRTLAMWERLGIRTRGSVNVVVNRQTKRSEVTASLAARILEGPISATLPDGGTAFESAMNTATVATVSTPVHAAIGQLAVRLLEQGTRPDDLPGLEAAVGAAPASTSRRGRRVKDLGQSVVELPAVIMIALVLFLAAAQGVAWSTGFLMARNAAYEAARTVGLSTWSGATAAAARDDAIESLSGGWRSRATVSVSPSEVTVNVRPPSLIPGGDRMTASVTAPVQAEP